mmetsp:Transcript_5426/g.11971  ORF Transcript_5426/g.11971 Transcript_5426/m.11971 type:complete len:84 (-) Transcript_5426:261-512(-)
MTRGSQKAVDQQKNAARIAAKAGSVKNSGSEVSEPSEPLNLFVFCPAPLSCMSQSPTLSAGNANVPYPRLKPHFRVSRSRMLE